MGDNRNKRHAKEDIAGRKKRLAIEATAKQKQRESAFHEECSVQDVKYVPPKHDESTKEKRARRKDIRVAFTSRTTIKPKPQKERRKCSREIHQLHPSLCSHCTLVLNGESSCLHDSKCSCIRPPPKKTFHVTGQSGAPIYSSSALDNYFLSFRQFKPYCTEYISDENVYTEEQTSSPDFLHPVLYEDRDTYSDNHEFTIDIATQYKNDWKHGIKQQCKVKDVMSAELHINETFFMRFGDCQSVYLHDRIWKYDGGIIVIHFFNPKHGTTPWGWEECITVHVDISPMQEDVIDDAIELIEQYSDCSPWNGSELYELLNDRGIHGVKFTTINFSEFSIRSGDAAHGIIKRKMKENRLAANYGPNWRELLLIEAMEEKKREEEARKEWRKQWEEAQRLRLEEDKRKYWKCPKGLEHCDLRNIVQGCCEFCTWLHLGRYYYVSKKTFSKCIDGHEICHDGLRQCPSCKDANRPLNPKRFKCTWCNEYLSSISLCQFIEHKCLCGAKASQIIRVPMR